MDIIKEGHEMFPPAQRQPVEHMTNTGEEAFLVDRENEQNCAGCHNTVDFF